MKWRRILLVGVLTMGPSVAMAQDPSEKTERPNRPGIGQRLRNLRGGEGSEGEMRAPEMMARGLAMMARNFPLMKALDADEDGRLSATEIENAPKSLLKLDKNGDGILSEEEMRPEPGPWMNLAGPGGPLGGPGPGGPGPGGPGPGGPGGLLRMFESRDKDGDGKLSGDEIPEPMRPRLNMIDANGDGSVEKSEIEKAMARMEGRGQANRRERPNGGGEGVTPKRPPREDEDPNKNDKD